MAFTKTIDDCDSYYRPDNHIKANKWKSFDAELRKAAFTQAQRDVIVYLNRTLDNPQTNDIYRDDYAIYEQALYMLEHGNIQKDAGSDGVVKIGRNEQFKADDNWLSPQALRYMAVSKVKVARG